MVVVHSEGAKVVQPDSPEVANAERVGTAKEDQTQNCPFLCLLWEISSLGSETSSGTLTARRLLLLVVLMSTMIVPLLLLPLRGSWLLLDAMDVGAIHRSLPGQLTGLTM